MTGAAEYGGQGLPHLARFIFDEFLCSANLSFSMYPELGHGAAMTLEKWGNEPLKQRFLTKMTEGTWGGTMCLTEAHAGTDLGIIRTKAVPNADGSYQLTGQKIFISAGDHDLTENVCHLVLAKIPDAPAGTRGISMFLVPKYLPTDSGEVGAFNHVSCSSIEHKMGIKANATCVINFDDATGWLVGDVNKGMRAMFTMMNGARLGVGMQGLGLAEVSYQNALAYAKDRVQGRALTGAKNPTGDADPIVVHPDVRRMLLTMKAYIEGERALAYWVGKLIDVEEKSTDEEEKQAAGDLVALMTPIIKSFLTDTGFEVTNLGLQIYGGHGYIREWGMEQFVRDARIAQIYEGTNGVQAMDLIGRKVPEGGGRMMRRWLKLVQDDVKAAGSDRHVADLARLLGESVRTLQETTAHVMQAATKNPDEAGAAAADFLRLMGTVATGWMWLRMARVALEKLPTANGDAGFYDAKVKTAPVLHDQDPAAGAGARREYPRGFGAGDGAGARLRGCVGWDLTRSTRARCWDGKTGRIRSTPADPARCVHPRNARITWANGDRCRLGDLRRGRLQTIRELIERAAELAGAARDRAGLRRELRHHRADLRAARRAARELLVERRQRAGDLLGARSALERAQHLLDRARPSLGIERGSAPG